MQTFNKSEKEIQAMILEQIAALVTEFRELKTRQIEMNKKLSALSGKKNASQE